MECWSGEASPICFILKSAVTRNGPSLIPYVGARVRRIEAEASDGSVWMQYEISEPRQ